MTAPDFEDQPPQTDRLSAYDERHLVTYLRLLDAEKDGAHWEEAVAIIFSIDPTREPERAKLVYDGHLARAKWMTESGYRHLLDSRTN
ncbi:DNA -binding domain-containing protein [Sphingobium fluviale]|jgi:hypothetical protein|uniref:DUF2285 domain-containing protein n=1 Tax=Sphingobium fluviale TaxID=2506423 RepID=A0A4Q1KL73_9SPHN|nr:DUF2285 domain-containing protein [Sphingobium fluviale]MAF61632.1 DUF2285 domain-containing protein [Blastomonas sp.]RXR30205.1 DUF2285 domain-containing protein [Sphingobium fluviale]|tara:strand:+ start:99457 stop:99720 length:264 start_codon:yes stop_codon:yes gene_type:complete